MGRLALSKEKKLQHSNLPEEACIITYLGKNYDGWWTAEDLHKQVRDAAIPIFDAQFPNAKISSLLTMRVATQHLLKMQSYLNG